METVESFIHTIHYMKTVPWHSEEKKYIFRSLNTAAEQMKAKTNFDLGLFMSFFFPFKIKSTLMSVLKDSTLFSPCSCLLLYRKGLFPQ